MSICYVPLIDIVSKMGQNNSKSICYVPSDMDGVTVWKSTKNSKNWPKFLIFCLLFSKISFPIYKFKIRLRQLVLPFAFHLLLFGTIHCNALHTFRGGSPLLRTLHQRHLPNV